MSEGMDFQRMSISSNVSVLTTFEPAIFHVLTPDMSGKTLGGAAHLVADGTGSISKPDST